MSFRTSSTGDLGTKNPITSTGQVIINCSVNPNETMTRLRELDMFREEHGPADTRSMGPVSHVTDVNLSINQGQLFMMSKRKNMTARGVRHVVGFGSFNGIPFPEGMTQSEFEDEYRCVGVITRSLAADTLIQGSYNVAVQIAGTHTIKNTSMYSFAPGDIWGWEAPSVDPEVLSKQMHLFETHSSYKGYGSQKLVPLIKKITPDDVVNHFHDLAKAVVQNSDKLNFPVFMNRMSSAIDLDQSFTHSACVLKGLNCFIGFVATVLAIEHGIVTYNTSGAPSTKTAVAPEQIENLARVFGLIDTPSLPSPIKEDERLVEDICKFVMFGSCASLVEEEREAIGRQIDAVFGTHTVDPKTVPSSSIGPVTSLPGQFPTQEAQLTKIFNNMYPIYGRVLTNAWSNIYKNAKGIVLSYASPGESMDVLLQ